MERRRRTCPALSENAALFGRNAPRLTPDPGPRLPSRRLAVPARGQSVPESEPSPHWPCRGPGQWVTLAERGEASVPVDRAALRAVVAAAVRASGGPAGRGNRAR